MKALPLIVIALFVAGISTDVRPVPAKAYISMVVTLDGAANDNDVSVVKFRNAYVPIVSPFVVAGMVTDVRAVFWKAYIPILVSAEFGETKVTVSSA